MATLEAAQRIAAASPAPSNATSAGGAIVVGASSGIGAALVRALAGEGRSVGALARRAGELEALAQSCRDLPGRVVPLAHDVRDVQDVPALVERLARELGGLELLVFAAGIMPEVGPQEYDTAKDLDLMAVNFGGCVAWCNAVSPLFRTQRSGTIVGISSIAGERGRKPAPVYGSSKAAMNHYLEALRNRLAEHGVHVCTVKPGYVDTGMTRGKKTFWLIGPDEAARAILAAARGRASVRFVPRRWALVALALRSIPSAIFRHLSF